MWHTLKLLLPALIPSWNFFDIITPSPRIQYAVLKRDQDRASNWQPFRPRPEVVSFFIMLRRMIWNPHWNESLFIMSCAERLLESPTPHSENEILMRIAHDLGFEKDSGYENNYLQFRLLLIKRGTAGLEEEPVYESRPISIKALMSGDGSQ